jgi:hypothetical protein
MYRAFLTAAVVLVLVTPIEAKRVIVNYTPIQKLVRADAVIVGKVTAIEKDTVDAAPFPGAPNKLVYKVAVIKIESGIVGAANTTHIKVGFIPPPPADPTAPPSLFSAPVIPTEGMHGLFYLTRHHGGEFYTIDPLLPPIESTASGYLDQVAPVKKGAAVLAEPMKALGSEKGADRFFAASVLIHKYRTHPGNVIGGKVETQKVPAEESKLILKGLTDGDWKPAPNDPNALNPYGTFSLLGITEKDGFELPIAKPNEDFAEKSKEAFVKWLSGPGKDFQISKWVVKK